jgi:hypothetical protein
MDQPLVLLPDRIDWDRLASKVAVYFSKEGRPDVPARFMLGMLMLKSVETRLCGQGLSRPQAKPEPL